MNPARSLTSTGSLPHDSANGACLRDRLVARGERADHLDQAHRRRRVEEVDAAHPLGPFGHHRQLDDREGRRVRGEDRLVLDGEVEPAEQLLLDVEVLDDRLEDEIAVGQRVQVVRGRDPREDLVALALVELAPLDLLVERLAEPGDHGIGGLLLTGPEDHLDARLGRHLRDAGSHDPGADDPQALDHGP